MTLIFFIFIIYLFRIGTVHIYVDICQIIAIGLFPSVLLLWIIQSGNMTFSSLSYLILAVYVGGQKVDPSTNKHKFLGSYENVYRANNLLHIYFSIRKKLLLTN